MKSWFPFSFLLFLFIITVNHLSSAADTITAGRSLIFRKTLTSKGGTFELGFFNPGNSLNYYIGIWYKKISVHNRTYVWVANRDIPLTGGIATSELKILEDGNLVLFNSLKVMVWSTNLTSKVMNKSEAALGDDGNLVLRIVERPEVVLWQSFDYPTDTILPGGRIRYDNRTKKSCVLTSWKNSNDPSKGLYSLKLDPIGNQYVLQRNQTFTYWSSGPWNGQNFKDAPEMASSHIYNYSYFKNENESYFTYTVYNSSILSRHAIDLSGQFMQFLSSDDSGEWSMYWARPTKQCDVYAFCGAFSVCHRHSLPVCQCMEGFKVQSPKDWNRSDFSGGCVRNKPLQCGKKETFSTMSNVRLPLHEQSLGVANENDCKFACLNNCSCSAYAYSNRCTIWSGNLFSLQEPSKAEDGELEFHFKLEDFHIHHSRKNGAMTGAIVGSVTAALIMSLIVCYIGKKKRSNWKGNAVINMDGVASTNKSQKEDIELAFFDVITVATATNQFSFSNEIGHGGFGPVYKGVLPTGEEIAVKRLSEESRQGIEEFMNEVVLIAKLQHRNLVRLLGYCIHGEERMLIYEYLPNKSLDFFIFDKKNFVLDLEKCFSIIIGIARGLLYLHRDSRLKIIHRDLKASNVLLDDQMNPKISDFGMARTFRADQTEENTMRVVGTYGYMSPEYAAEGLFSMKSDVFSFGVLVLEIVSGERNRGFHHSEHYLNLLGHAWKLLNDDKALELIDPSIRDTRMASEMLKCIQVGLLCVQNFPEDRPTMSSVLSMLDSDGVMLPWPKQPGFYTERSPVDGDSVIIPMYMQE